MSNFPTIVLRGKTIRQDDRGHFSLDDIWELAQAPGTKVPKLWRQQVAVKRLENELQKKVTAGYLNDGLPIIPVAYAKRGRGSAGTFAHPVLAAAYAGYLSPKLEIEVREVWLRYRAGDPALADEILERASPNANEWAAMRALARARRVGYTDTLRDHGVTGAGYWQCTNAVYRRLLSGNAREIRRFRGLKPTANVRDHLATDELAYVMAAEALATDRITEENRQGNTECEMASARSAGFIREAIDRDKRDRRPKLPPT